MKVNVERSCVGVDWMIVSDTLKSVGMAYFEPDVHCRAFEASHTTVFLYNDMYLIGFGRAISDGIYQAAIYDCAVLPEYQGKGLGALIINSIMTELSHCNIILYATPGKEGFYEAHGFRKMKTGMACFKKDIEMKERGFTE